MEVKSEKIFLPENSVFNEVPVYNSDSDNDRSDCKDKKVLAKKKRGENIKWVFVKKFNSIQEAEDTVRSENTWSILITRNTEEGKKRVYRCNKVKYRGVQCAAQIYLLFEADSEDVILFRTHADHNHDTIGVRSDYGITQQTKTEINKLLDLHLKPKSILHTLKNIPGLKLPTIKQLNNYLSDYRKFKYGSKAISLEELEKWLQNHIDVPEDIHQVFVMSYCINESDPPKFRFALSTKYLLKLASCATVLHADATYKLLWQGFPIFILGTTDKNNKLYPFCLAVSNSVTTEDFEMLFSGLKTSVASLYEHTLQPDVLVCDATKAIQNSFTNVFGNEPKVRMCWAHARKDMKTKLEQTIELENQNYILKDIDCLQTATSPQVFDLASELFLKKWEKEEAFTNYFKEEWLVNNRYWYLGVAPNSPITNNALEATNKLIRDYNTLRERLPLSRFVVAASNIVTKWSENPEIESFATIYTVKLSDWTEAYQWVKMDKTVTILHSNGDENTYLLPSNKDPQKSNIMYLQHKWRTFDEYKDNFFSNWKVTMPKDGNLWMNSKCSCPQFALKYMCKHVLGLAIRLKYATAPLEAKVIQIGKKRKRGRPTKYEPALIIQ